MGGGTADELWMSAAVELNMRTAESHGGGTIGAARARMGLALTRLDGMRSETDRWMISRDDR
jgi:hypothetical protein